jgi:PAS domain S-box-containing protein
VRRVRGELRPQGGKEAETRAQAAQQLLLAITRTQALFIDEAQPARLFGVLLEELLTLTNSAYGFIGEVERIAEGQPFLRIHAMTDIAWNEDTKALMAQKVTMLELHDLKTLFGHVMTTGKPVIVNDPAHDPRAGGLPPGHPPMHALLGLPFFHGGVMTGMVGIANRSGGYDETLVAYLQPLLGTCGQLVEGFCNRRFRNKAEQALRVSEDRFQVAVQGANDGIWDWDLRTNQVYFSERWKNMLGYEDHEITDVYSEWESRLHPDDHARVLSGLTSYLQHQQDAYAMEFRLRKKDDTYCWIHARGKAVRDVEGRPYRMAGSHADITEQKREEAFQSAQLQVLELVAKGQALNEVLAFFCRAFEACAAPMLSSVMLVTEDGAHLSSAAGPSLPDEYNRLVHNIPIGPNVGSCGSAAFFRKPVIAADIATDPSWKDYASVPLAYGLKACWSQPIVSSTGVVLGTFAAYHRTARSPQPAELKIVERASHIAALAIEHAQMIDALRESEARFQTFMRHSPAVTFIKDAVGRHVYVNAQFEAVFGLSREAVKDKTVFDFMPVDVAGEMHRNDQLVLSSGQTLEAEEAVPTPDGKAKSWLVVKFPLELGHKQLVGGMALDITERKRLEQASQDQTDRLRLAMDIARLATWDWNILTNQVIWSENCEAVKGLPRGSFDGTFEAYQRLVHPEDLPKLLADIEGALSGQQPYHTEHRIVPPTGEVQWIEGNGVVYRDELGRPIRMVGTVRNITARKRIEQAMRVSEERYARATAVGRVGVWELDVRAGTYYGDRNLKAMFGYQPDELSTDPLAWLNLVHPDDQAIAMDHWQRIVNRDTDDYNYELRMTREDGTVIWTEVRGHAVRTADGQLTHLIGATLDITDRKRAEESLLRTQFAMDHAVDAVYWINPQAGILYTNAAASAMLGYTKEEFLRMTVHDLNPDFPAEVWPGWWAEMREKKVMSLETVHQTKDGRRIPIDIRVSFLAYGGQEFHCAYVRDISERKRVDEALRASQERFELAAKASNDGIWDWNILTGEQYWSDRHLELFGLERSAFIPTYDAWIAQVHPDDADWVHRTTQRHLDTREPYDIEVRVKVKDGSYRWFRDRGQAVWDSTGRPVRMVGSISDVTERRNSEEAIWNAHAELEQRVMERTKQVASANRALEEEIIQRKRVEDRLQRTQYAVDHAANQIFVIGSDGYFLDVNESACCRLGYTKEELLKMSVMDLDPDFPQAVWSEFWAGFAQVGQVRLETRHRSKSGEIYPVEVVGNYLCHDGQELDYAIVRDLTERRRSEAAIRESELRYKLVTEATFDAIALHDNGVLIEVNAGLERMFGYQSGELLGRSILDLIADESRDHVVRNMGDGMIGPYEAMGRRKDGTTFAGEVVVRPYCFRGKQVRLVAGRDITARKQLERAMARHTEELERQVSERTAEVAKLESQRAQSEKLAAVGQLAAAVAHEINNPIAGIRNAFTLVKQAVDQAHPHYEFVGMIDREISRVADIVRNMYQLYRKQPSKTEPVDLRLLLDDLNALFAKQLSQGDMTFVATLQCSITTLQVPRGDLLQVLMNLIQNAIDSSGQGRTIGLTVCEEEGTVNISVSDEGGGITPDVLPHIFDPFFTTKTEKYQKGMGLGLSVSQSLVMAMGGRIEVRTELKTGSTFSVVLPQLPPGDRSTAQQHIMKEVVTHDY